MAAPNMATITASIERSLQNCSLRSDTNNATAAAAAAAQPRFRGGRGSTISESALPNTSTHDSPDNTLELNSQLRLPYYWEQCLDLKTGEVYYINWRTGTKSRYDPRTMNPEMNVNIGDGGGFLSSEEEEKEDNEQSANGSQGSSAEKESSYPSPSSSTTTSRSEQCRLNIPGIPAGRHSEYESENDSSNDNYKQRPQQVLVVAGCKGCFMYFMVPKQVEDCPKCFGQLLHFDRPDTASP